MLQKGILNPAVNDLLSRIRHTNTIVIADWAFPYWNEIEVVDLSLTKGIPLITDFLELLKENLSLWKEEDAENAVEDLWSERNVNFKIYCITNNLDSKLLSFLYKSFFNNSYNFFDGRIIF